MITDQDGNEVHDGDWLGFNLHGLARGSVAMVSEAVLTSTNGQKQPSFVNVLIQIPCAPGTTVLPGVSRILGPAIPKVEG